jgi:predicted nucleic acid-binding protein
MIILDTNVISETMRSQPDPSVLTWLDERAAAGLFVSTITEAEIRFGVARLPKGKRRNGLATAAEQAFETLFRDRVLPFDRDAARAYATIAGHRTAIGRPISQFDCQIAAIARSRGAAVATRNVEDFAECGLEITNPWDAS